MSIQDYANYAREMAKKKIKKELKNKFKKLIMQKLMPILIKYVLPVVAVIAACVVLIVVIEGAISGETSALGGGFSGGNGGGYIGSGSNSVFFDNTITREEFIQMAKNYSAKVASSKVECYNKAFVDYAGDYYDISVQYGFDPRATFCTGIQESDFGTSRIAKDKCNYWGIGAEDDDPYNKAKTYSSIPEGIKDLCELWKRYTTPGTSHYTAIVSGGYNPNTIEGIGYRYASDTTWANQKVSHMKNIFGYAPNTVSGGSIYDAAVALHNAQTSWSYGTAGEDLTFNNIENAINNPRKKTCCATYVSSVLYKAGCVTKAEIDGINYNKSTILNGLLEKKGWTKITSYDALQGNDIVFMDTDGGTKDITHVQICAKRDGNDYYWFNAGTTECIQDPAPYKDNRAITKERFYLAYRPPR